MSCNTPDAEEEKKQKIPNPACVLFVSFAFSFMAAGWTTLLLHQRIMTVAMISYFIAITLFFKFTPFGKKLALKIAQQGFSSTKISGNMGYPQPFQGSSHSSCSYDFPHPQSTLSLTSRCSGSNYY